MGCTRHVALTWEMKNTYKIFVRTAEGKRAHERPRHRWGDNINKY
jgi:hypothetical protein